jgi:hypothetical protein
MTKLYKNNRKLFLKKKSKSQYKFKNLNKNKSRFLDSIQSRNKERKRSQPRRKKVANQVIPIELLLFHSLRKKYIKIRKNLTYIQEKGYKPLIWSYCF